MNEGELDGILRQLHGGLVVSCQASPGDPLHGPVFMAAMARAAVLGGAVGIRANGPADIVLAPTLIQRGTTAPPAR